MGRIVVVDDDSIFIFYKSKYVTKHAETAPQKLSTDAAITTTVVEWNAAMTDPYDLKNYITQE